VCHNEYSKYYKFTRKIALLFRAISGAKKSSAPFAAD